MAQQFKPPKSNAMLTLTKKNTMHAFTHKNEGLKIVEPSWRVADGPRDHLLFHVLSPEGKVKLTMKWSSRCVIDQFHEVVPYFPMTQNAKRLKSKSGR
ncbi:hypothetical protein H5410_061118 [Solanum commersonii]|uniref:Uncharacterized protein n=1 Tax=Solanum commersonii TaxID=4109 RepID=A0A9J5W870_SOLCO|nr:hypothetical protein H5410_061118 [Solanum commersonii]